MLDVVELRELPVQVRHGEPLELLQRLAAQVRAVDDFLAETLPDPPAWDRALAGRVPGF